MARPFVNPELEVLGKKTIRQRMSRSAGNKMPRTHACRVHGDRRVTDRLGTLGQREKDGGGSVAHPPIDFLLSLEVVRDIRDEDQVLVFACRIGDSRNKSARGSLSADREARVTALRSVAKAPFLPQFATKCC